LIKALRKELVAKTKQLAEAKNQNSNESLREEYEAKMNQILYKEREQMRKEF